MAWRVHDAQYWGVPQRRRRISVVADFGGDTASEILFDRKSVSGDIAESGAAREGFAEAAEAGTSYAVRIRGGCDGGGKGALVQTEVSGTLGCNNDQTVFCLQGNCIDRADTARCNGKGWTQDKCYTPNTIDRPAVCAKSSAHIGAKAYGIGYMDEQSPTLSSQRHDASVVCLNDQGGNMMGVSYDVSGTLRAQEHGHQPHILDMSHACDIIRECGELAPSLQARMGTGGNQVPLVAYGIGNGQANEASIVAEEVSQTLNTMHDAQAILYQPKSAMEENWAESETKNALRAGESKVSHAIVCEDVNHALRARAGCAYREDAETYPVQNMVVRRLTPLECERLQGFPDGWTDIGDYTDSAGKKRKTSDSARYKALGNSIALPFWRWMFGRMAAYLPECATLGSLFDGIGGFPLCWENIHGAGTAIWASEIEEFPIAVTKLRFGGAIT